MATAFIWYPKTNSFEQRMMAFKAPQWAAQAAKYTFLVKHAAGTVTFNGERYNVTDAATCIAAPDTTHVYLVEHALVGGARASGAAVASAGAASAVAASSAALAPAFFRTTNIRVATWAPQVQANTTKDAPALLGDMAMQLAQCPDADVFMLPESYFCRWENSPLMLGRKMIPLSMEEDAALLVQLAGISRKYPDCLIIPGTIISQAKSGTKANHTVLFLGGNKIASTTGHTDYRKRGVHAEHKYQGNNWYEGDRGCFDFAFKGLRCRLEICADHATGPAPAQPFDLQFIVALGLGGNVSASVHEGGWCVLVDGDGRASTFQKGSPIAKVKAPPQSLRAFDLEIRTALTPDELATQRVVSAQLATNTMPLPAQLLDLVGLYAS